jgi:hypothetical protein
MFYILLKNKTKIFVLAIFFLVLKFNGFAYAADSRLRLNYEAVKFRVMLTRQIEILENLHSSLHLCEMLFPIQTQAEIKKKGVDVNPEKIYRNMLSMKSSGEIFKWYLDFLSENETLRENLRKTFIPVNSVDERKAIFRLGTIEFSVRWFWLYPTRDGLTLVAQDEMTQTTAEEIWKAGVLRYVFEVRIPLSENLRKSPFWEKGMAKIFKSFPSARVAEDPLELVYSIFPVSSGIPAIVQRSLELAIE